MGCQLVGGDEVRPESGGAVLPFGRTELNLHLGELEIAGRPVIHQHVAGDVCLSILPPDVSATSPDHRGNLKFEIEEGASRWYPHCVVRPLNRIRVGEVERRRRIPLLRRSFIGPPEFGHALDMAFEGHEVTDRWW